MIKYLTLLFFIIFVFYSSASSSLLEKCKTVFRSDPVKYNLFLKDKWTSAYSKELFSSVYKEMPLLKGILSDTEMNFYVSVLEEAITYFEKETLKQIEFPHQSDLKTRMKLMDSDSMNPKLFNAMKSFPEIVRFLKSGKAKDYEALDTEVILKIILSTFSQHMVTYLTHSLKELDWTRLNLIIKSISDFKDQPNAFSLYKIQRVVKEKYSIKEYINCK